MENNLFELLQQIEGRISLENDKQYWLVRTDDGRNYQEFARDNYVALNLLNYPVNFIDQIIRDFADKGERIFQIKDNLIRLHQENWINLTANGNQIEGASLTRLANQIYTICKEIKRGDIVVIPDRGADNLRIGKVTENCFVQHGAFSFARNVEWIKEIRKNRLDPCLYKALGAHQAVCNITKYAEYIERNYNSYFVVGENFHYVLTVNAEKISAYSLTKTINGLLDTIKEISEQNHLGVNVESISFTVNVNSPGKFSFVTTAKNAALIMAIAVAMFGGRVTYEGFEASTNGAFSSLVECVNDYLDRDQKRQEKAALFEQYINSLDLQSVENINNMVDENLNEDEEAELQDENVE